MYGRGRGRGRGRGGRSMTPAALRSEVGEAAAAELDKPPQLFPEIELPIVPDLDREGSQLLGYWRSLGHFYKTSCYNLQTAEAKKRPVEDDPYAPVSRLKAAVDRGPLSSVLTLDSKYFPEELFSATEKRASVRATSAKAFQPTGGKDAGADIFDRFAKLESGEGTEEDRAGRRRAGGAAREEGQKERGAEGPEDEEQLPEDEDDEALQDDDDYLMGETFDDDEGYDDPYNDGDDEGPTY